MGHGAVRAVVECPVVIIVIVVVERRPARRQCVLKAGVISVLVILAAVAHLIVAARICARPADSGCGGGDARGGEVGHHVLSHIDGDAGDGQWLSNEVGGWCGVAYLALLGAEGLNVIAVFDDDALTVAVLSTREGGTTVGLDIHRAGLEDTVDELDASPVAALCPTHEAAAVVGGSAEQLAVEGAAGEGDV